MIYETDHCTALGRCSTRHRTPISLCVKREADNGAERPKWSIGWFERTDMVCLSMMLHWGIRNLYSAACIDTTLIHTD